MDSGRLNWIDSLKGFGILLVVLGHIHTDHILFIRLDSIMLINYIYSFHIPLFFFISGYLFNSDKWISKPYEFIRSRFNSIVLPYFNFMIINIISLVAFSYITNFPIDFLRSSPIEIVYNVLYAHYTKIISINGAMWFLPALFITEILYFAIEKILKNKYLIVTAVLILSQVGAYFHYPAVLPWHINSALFSLLFYTSGKLFRDYQNNFLTLDTEYILLLLCTHLGLACLFTYDLQGVILRNEVLFYITAMSGILFYTRLLYKIGNHLPLLEWLGKNSITILCTHIFFIYFIAPYWGITDGSAIFFLTILAEIPIILVINKHGSLILGKPFVSSSLKTKVVDSIKRF